MALSPGCELKQDRNSSTAAVGRFLLACGIYQQRLLNVVTGEITQLPVLGGTWEMVGALYVDGDVDARLCPRSRSGAEQVCRALYDIATGSISYRPLSQQPDLGRAGAPPTCARLRKQINVAEQQSIEFSYWNGILVEAARHGGDLRIERCTGRPAVVGAPHDAGNTPENFDLHGGLLTWDTGHPASSFQSEEEAGGQKLGDLRRGALFSDLLATHTRHSWRLPRRSLQGEEVGLPTTGVFGYSTHTKNMVFWIATRYCHEGRAGGSCSAGETFSVYAARL
jgi:hypothetical protein